MTTKQSEMRCLATDIDARGAGATPKISGYAAKFGAVATIEGRFEERFAAGAFSETLRSDDQVMLLNHDWSAVLGRRSVGTLRLSEDAVGLRAECDPPDTTAGRDAVVSIRRGDIQGMSLRFIATDDAWEQRAGGALPLRTVLKAQLLEVSPVTRPAYAQTSVGVRSAEEVLAGQPRTGDSDTDPLRWRLRLAESELL